MGLAHGAAVAELDRLTRRSRTNI